MAPVSSWVVVRFTNSGTPLPRLLVATKDEVFTVDPVSGRVTLRKKISQITKTSWDKRTDELFRIVFKEADSLDNAYLFLSADRNAIIGALVARMKYFLVGGVDPTSTTTEADGRVEFTVQGVDADGDVHPHILVLEPGQVVHVDARTRIPFSSHPYRDIDSLVCDEDVDPLALSIRYLNDSPYNFFIFARDKSRLATCIRGRTHLFKRIIPGGVDRYMIGDFDGVGSQGATETGFANKSVAEAIGMIEQLKAGTWLWKHTKNGRGKPHKRWFSALPAQGGEEPRLFWGTSKGQRRTSAEIVAFSEMASSRVAPRGIPNSFTVAVRLTKGARELDLFARSDTEAQLWTHGLLLLLQQRSR